MQALNLAGIPLGAAPAGTLATAAETVPALWIFTCAHASTGPVLVCDPVGRRRDLLAGRAATEG